MSGEGPVIESASFAEDFVELETYIDEEGYPVPVPRLTYTLISSDPVAIKRWRNARRTLIGGDSEVRELKAAKD